VILSERMANTGCIPLCRSLRAVLVTAPIDKCMCVRWLLESCVGSFQRIFIAQADSAIGGWWTRSTQTSHHARVDAIYHVGSLVNNHIQRCRVLPGNQSVESWDYSQEWAEGSESFGKWINEPDVCRHSSSKRSRPGATIDIRIDWSRHHVPLALTSRDSDPFGPLW